MTLEEFKWAGGTKITVKDGEAIFGNPWETDRYNELRNPSVPCDIPNGIYPVESFEEVEDGFLKPAEWVSRTILRLKNNP